MEIQKFLRENNGEGKAIAMLLERFAIKSSRHSKYNNLVLFKYNQIDSPFAEPIVCECRGIVLDENNDWNVVSHSFNKFFNNGEGFAAPIDWNTAKVQEKADGSLLTLYFYNGEWHVQTTGMPDASGEVNGFGFSFKELFWRVFNTYNIDLAALPKHMCFMFELMTPHNKIVVQHKESRLVCLGARDLASGKEIHAKEVVKIWAGKIPAIKEFPLTSFEEIKATFPDLNPLDQEGYVIVDENFNRQKSKSPAYIALHHLAGGLSSLRSLVSVVINGEIEEVIVPFPEYKENLFAIKDKLDEMILGLESAYEVIKEIPVQKDFAKEALKTKCAAALFSVRSKKSESISSHVRGMQIDSIIQLLGLKESPSKKEDPDVVLFWSPPDNQ